MVRLTFLFVCILGVVPSASANLARKEPPADAKRVRQEMLKPVVLAAPKQEYCVTENTEVLLNGRPCKYDEVPADAVILRMEIASSANKEILKIHFRSESGPVKRNARQADNHPTPARKPIP